MLELQIKNTFALIKRITGITPYAVIIFLFLLSEAAIGSEEVGRYYEEALKSSQQGKLSEAIIHLKNGLQRAPDHLPSRLMMAELLIRQGNGATAEAELGYAKARGASENRLLPLVAEAYLLQDKYSQVLDIARAASRERQLEANLAYYRGRAHIGLHQLSSAYREFNQALELQPQLVKAKLGMAQVLIQRDQLDQAGLYLDEVLSSPSASANAWLLNANIQRLKGDMSGSIVSLNRAITMERGHLAARLARSALLMQGGKMEMAEEDIDFILSEIPSEPRARYIKAIISAFRGDIKDAAEKIGDVMATLKAVPPEVMKNNPSYLYLAGVTSFQLGSYDLAKSYLNKYLKVTPNDIDSMRTLAVIELKTGKPEYARAILAKANVYYPNNPQTLSLLGVAYMDMNRADLAQPYFQRAVELEPDSGLMLTYLAQSKFAQGNANEAIEHLIQAKEAAGSSIELSLFLAEAYVQSNRYKSAAQIYRELVESSPKSSYYAQLYAVALGLDGDHKGARQWLERALDLDPGNSQAMIHLSRMKLAVGDKKDAVAFLEERLSEFPEKVELISELGKTHARLHNWEQATEWFKKAYAINNNDRVMLDGLVDALVNSDKALTAVEVIDDFIGRNPTDGKAYELLGFVFQSLNEKHKAIGAYSSAVNFSARKSPTLMILAKALLAVGDREEAIASLRKSIAYDEDYLEGYIALIKLVIEDKEADYALRLISSVRRLTPGTPASDLLTAELHEGLGDLALAEESYNKAMVLGDNRQAVLGLTRLYLVGGKEKKAINHLQAWLKKYPDDSLVELTLANVYADFGRLNEAKAHFEKLLVQVPGSAVIVSSAASTFFLAGEKEAALKLAHKALDLSPKRVDSMDTLGWIQSRMGDSDAALATFREALVYDFGNPGVKYHLAVTLAQLERTAEAKKLLGEILESTRESGDRDKAQQLLVTLEAKMK